jgi:hypothetical protein
MERRQFLESNEADSTPATLLPLEGYVRVSRVGPRVREDLISPELQEEQIRSYASSRSRELAHIYV